MPKRRFTTEEIIHNPSVAHSKLVPCVDYPRLAPYTHAVTMRPSAISPVLFSTSWRSASVSCDRVMPDPSWPSHFMLKRQLLILNRTRHRAPRLRPAETLPTAVCSEGPSQTGDRKVSRLKNAAPVHVGKRAARFVVAERLNAAYRRFIRRSAVLGSVLDTSLDECHWYRRCLQPPTFASDFVERVRALEVH